MRVKKYANRTKKVNFKKILELMTDHESYFMSEIFCDIDLVLFSRDHLGLV